MKEPRPPPGCLRHAPRFVYKYTLYEPEPLREKARRLVKVRRSERQGRERLCPARKLRHLTRAAQARQIFMARALPASSFNFLFLASACALPLFLSLGSTVYMRTVYLVFAGHRSFELWRRARGERGR